VVCQPEDCSNGIDDDADRLIDCADPECVGAVVCRAEVCDNGVDDNANGQIDCAEATCANDPACAALTPFTQAEIQALFDRDCQGCHVGGASLGGLVLDAPFTANTVNVPSSRVRINLDRIEPGDRNRSFLWLKLAGQQGALGGNDMPQGGAPYDAVTLERIALWIERL